MIYMHLSKEVKALAAEISEEYGLDGAVALQLALECERNEILRQAFVVTKFDNEFTPMEAIIIALDDLKMLKK